MQHFDQNRFLERCFSFAVLPGERILKLHNNGLVSFQDGPSFVMSLYLHRIARMRCFTAKPNEYTQVTFHDGTVQILPGPTNVFENPVEIKNIVVKPALELRTSEAIVVYRNHASFTTKREIVFGPKLYIPSSASDLLHEFKWHGKSTPFQQDISMQPTSGFAARDAVFQSSQHIVKPNKSAFAARDAVSQPTTKSAPNKPVSAGVKVAEALRFTVLRTT